MEYQAQANDSYIPLNSQGSMESFDFNPNDNVTTEIIGNQIPFSPDYFLELDSNGDIISRWFVLEMKRNRQGQWLYSLKRDVIADNVQALMNSPVFVQKARLSDNNPLILNSEGMNFNQIKVDETLLKDKTKSSWLIGYFAKSSGGQDLTEQIPTSDITDAVTLKDIADDLGTTEAILSDLLNFDGVNSTPTRFIKKFLISYSHDGGLIDGQNAHWFNTDFIQTAVQYYNAFNPTNPLFAISDSGYNTSLSSAFRTAVHDHESDLNSDMLTLIGQNYYFNKSEHYKKIKAYEGKYVRYLGKYYRLHVIDSGSSNISHDKNFVYTKYTSLSLIASDTVSGHSWASLRTSGKYDEFESYADKVFLQMEEISDSTVIPVADIKISTARKVTADQQYDIIAIPADEMELTYDDNGTPVTVKTNGEIARRCLSGLCLKYDAEIYDIQLLPYCPIPYLEDGAEVQGTEGQDFDFIEISGPAYFYFSEVMDKAYITTTITQIGPHDFRVVASVPNMTVESGKAITIDSYSAEPKSATSPSVSDIVVESISIDDTTGIMTVQYTCTTSQNTFALEVIIEVNYHYNASPRVANFVFYCEKASFQQQIEHRLAISESMKIDSQCEMYRLLSPNYQGSFDFNVAKNGGSVEFFTAYCTYKPYTPFIKVCPEFNFVYGMDYNDNRGLICGGDFSLPRISSAWQSYLLNNKNYQNIFNREIQNLDFNQSLELRQQLITGGIGIGTDSIKGAMAGAVVGGGWGAVAGGIIGAGTSAVGYGLDIDIMAKQHQEARSFAIDKFNYQLGNIKALPYTLTKVGAFDISSKIFPVLEHYSCSEEEKEALRKKIQYESMTVMAIDLFGNYYKAFDELTYFKGELIRCDDIADDSHVLDAIYAELLKGVYM